MACSIDKPLFPVPSSSIDKLIPQLHQYLPFANRSLPLAIWNIRRRAGGPIAEYGWPAGVRGIKRENTVNNPRYVGH